MYKKPEKQPEITGKEYAAFGRATSAVGYHLAQGKLDGLKKNFVGVPTYKAAFGYMLEQLGDGTKYAKAPQKGSEAYNVLEAAKAIVNAYKGESIPNADYLAIRKELENLKSEFDKQGALGEKVGKQVGFTWTMKADCGA